MAVSAHAEPPSPPVSAEAEQAYLDLLLGYCLKSVSGRSLRGEDAERLDTWSKVEAFATNPPALAQQANVDLRAKDVAGAGLLVDAKNQVVCWTQVGGPPARTLAARFKAHLLARPEEGRLLDEGRSEPGAGPPSKLTLLALIGFESHRVPVFMIREPSDPTTDVVTVQVWMGTKNELK